MRKRASALVSFLMIVSVVTLGFALRVESAQEEDHHGKPPSEERVHQFDRQTVTVESFDAEGLILAIGGGGEGVIGRLEGEQVVAIDISKREMELTPPGPLKIVMDATDMQFLDESFGAAASFFTLCYIDGSDHGKVFDETFRVLVPGGTFRIWDMILGEKTSKDKDIAVMPLLVKLPNEDIETGYGVHWPEIPHDLPYYMELAKNAGFEVVDSFEDNHWFRLVLRKP